MAGREPEQRRLELVEGVNYLTDLYSVLGVPRSADEQTIHAAFLTRAKEYHPDLLQGRAPEFQHRAAQMMAVLNRASVTLSNPPSRETYNKKLEEWNGPISLDGRPVIDLKMPFYGNETLEKARRRADELIDETTKIFGFDPNTFELIEQMYKSTPNPDQRLRDMYEQALLRKQSDLAIREDTKREVLGIPTSSSMAPPIGFLAEAQDLVTSAKSRFTRHTESYLRALQSGEIKMLPGREDVVQALAQNPEEAIIRLSAEMLEKFDTASGDVLNLARQREEVITNRLELVRGEYVTDQPELTRRLIVCLQLGSGEKTENVWYAFELKGDEQEAVLERDDETQQQVQAVNDLERVAEMVKQGFNVMSVKHKEGLPPNEQLQRAVQEHYADYFEKQEDRS